MQDAAGADRDPREHGHPRHQSDILRENSVFIDHAARTDHDTRADAYARTDDAERSDMRLGMNEGVRGDHGSGMHAGRCGRQRMQDRGNASESSVRVVRQETIDRAGVLRGRM